MRTAIVADIHGNLGGLLAVLDDIAARNVDRILCLGDVVDGGGEDAAVIRLVRERGIPCIAGNHDLNNDLKLPGDEAAWLASLPQRIVEGDVVHSHGSPCGKMAYMRSPSMAWNGFESCSFRLAFVGHTHVPAIWRHAEGKGCVAELCEFKWTRQHRFEPEERYIVCVGAVGYSRDLVKRNRYAIHDSGADAVEMRSVKGPVIESRYWP